MFDIVEPHNGPVIVGLEKFETVYAKDQPQYRPLRTLPGRNGDSAIARFHFTDAQRKAIAEGADIYLELLHFKGPLAPSLIMVMSEPADTENFRLWWKAQTSAPYASELHQHHDLRPTREEKRHHAVRGSFAMSPTSRAVCLNRISMSRRYVKMSATICWRPISKSEKSLDVPAPSSFQEKMADAGFRLPCDITQADRAVLRGMAAGFGRNKDQPNPFDEILELLNKYDGISLWAVY